MEYQKTELSRTRGPGQSVQSIHPVSKQESTRNFCETSWYGLGFLAALDAAEHRLCINSGFIKG